MDLRANARRTFHRLDDLRRAARALPPDQQRRIEAAWLKAYRSANAIQRKTRPLDRTDVLAVLDLCARCIRAARDARLPDEETHYAEAALRRLRTEAERVWPTPPPAPVVAQPRETTMRLRYKR